MPDGSVTLCGQRGQEKKKGNPLQYAVYVCEKQSALPDYQSGLSV